MSKNRGHLKSLKEEDFKRIQENNCQPAELIGEGLPDWMKSIVKIAGTRLFASGVIDHNLNPGDTIGGADAFRDARDHPEPFDWNKDHYTIIKQGENESCLLVEGPIKDHEHWLNDIPDHLKDIQFIEYKKL